MKIISNNECYIQGYDLEHLIYNDSQFPVEMYMDMSNGKGHLSSLEKFYKVTDKSQIEYLMNNGIVADFEELERYNETGLKKLITFFKKELYDEYAKSDSDIELSASFAIDTFQKRRQIEYMIFQIKEMIKLKNNNPDIEFPNVPNPCELPLVNGDIKVCKSIVPNIVLAYNKDNKPLTNDIDYKFCDFAFEILNGDYMECCDNEEMEEFNEFSSDMKYYIKGYKTLNKVKVPNLTRKTK